MKNKVNDYINCGLIINILWALALAFIMVGPFIFSNVTIITGWWIGTCSFSIIALNTVFFIKIKRFIKKSEDPKTTESES